MKSQSYHYEKGKAHLDFSFPEDDNIEQAKRDFLDLLVNATEDLNRENVKNIHENKA